jgi:hypothetical protein
MFHDDWEIFGNGTGDPESLMFEPARRILDICDKYGAKYTFFAELGQQQAMLNSSLTKWRKIAAKWEEVLVETIKRGHDVQLHFHPQWIGAKEYSNHWDINKEYWHSANVDTAILEEWIKRSKEYLEGLLRKVNPTYETVAYRAGGWLCQPSTNLYYALKKNGLICDSSVVQGRYYDYGKMGSIDFRKTVSNTETWEVNPDNFALEEKGSGLWELPVYTEKTNLPLPLYLIIQSRNPLYYYRIFRGQRKSQKRITVKGIAAKSSNEKAIYGSVDYLYYKHLLKMVKRVQKLSHDSQKSCFFCFMAHSKSYLDFNNFDRLLSVLSKDNSIVFTRTRDFVRDRISDK